MKKHITTAALCLIGTAAFGQTEAVTTKKAGAVTVEVQMKQGGKQASCIIVNGAANMQPLDIILFFETGNDTLFVPASARDELLLKSVPVPEGAKFVGFRKEEEGGK